MLRTINANRDAMRKRTIMIGDAINNEWPRKDIEKTIRIQMDNATPHISEDDPEWIAAKSRWSFNIVLVRQPPQSPDCNVLDLGLWTSIQALQRKEPIIINARTEFELVRAVQKSFIKLPATTIDSCWETLTNILREIHANNGGNRFVTPRKRKYAPMVDDAEPSEDEWSNDDTDTEAEPDNDDDNGRDSDCDWEAKPRVLRQRTYVNSDSVEMAANV